MRTMSDAYGSIAAAAAAGRPPGRGGRAEWLSRDAPVNFPCRNWVTEVYEHAQNELAYTVM
jgi:hypothetical protein